MKTNEHVECRVSSIRRFGRAASPLAAGGAHGVTRPTRPIVNAFTLIEILVVIAIIAVLAALILPLAGAVKRHAFIQTAQSEMSQLETALESYHSAYGFYPPNSAYGPLTNQLYFELTGTTNTGSEFVTLDGSARIQSADVATTFGPSGFMNCDKANADESASRARNFLPGLKPNQVYSYTNTDNAVIGILVASPGGPDPDYRPFNNIQDVNPWRYVYPGTNNPGSYDLWVQLKIAGKKYLICNWTKQVQENNPLP